MRFNSAVISLVVLTPIVTAADSSAWWSFRPLAAPTIPTIPVVDDVRVRTPIDRFVIAELRKRGLSPSPEADRRTLIRRLYFDLIGLPPDPEEIARFVADTDPRAYEKLVDRLLDSPHYGERWARHWLDVVHFGETHGYDKDKPRPNAWPYRDYVIRAFNDDRPYSRFVQEQIAGDVLFPGTRDGIEGLGFLAAGPWDFIGHAELPESKIDGKYARHFDRDDMVSNTISSFMSLTVHCAQCHDHKFDPISQADYYALQAIFAAIDRTDRSYDVDPSVTKRRQELQSRARQLSERRRQLDTEIRRRAGPAISELDRQITRDTGNSQPRVEFGYHSKIESSAHHVKWVQVDLGKSVAIRSVGLVGCYDDFNRIGAGFGFPIRFRIEASDDPKFMSGITLIADETQSDYPNPGTEPREFIAKDVSARYVRVTATKLALRANDYIFALAEIIIRDRLGANVARHCHVTSFDSIEAPPRWQRVNLADGYFNTAKQSMSVETDRLYRMRQELLEAATDGKTRDQLRIIESQQREVEEEIRRLPKPSMAYVGAIHTGTGNFTGTGANMGRPRPIFILPRGDVTKPGPRVEPGVIAAISAPYQRPVEDSDGARRASLAKWLTSDSNPLVWRSIVNRVWQYHFGRGLVDTPGDFGRMGQPPSHPELLDWLAIEFRDRGQFLKNLHRLIVNSATYRQVSSGDRHSDVDADNRLLWRMNRRRLDAESVRDSILRVSGKLDATMYGPSFQDFVIEHPEHSPHYQYHLHDPEDRRCHRRSIYRFTVRSQQQPFMTAFDCADPSMRIDRRNETITPQQALSLLNNKLTIAMSRHFASRVQREAADGPPQVERAFRLAIGRNPTPSERVDLDAYGREHGLPSLCRVILNLNEFLFVD